MDEGEPFLGTSESLSLGGVPVVSVELGLSTWLPLDSRLGLDGFFGEGEFMAIRSLVVSLPLTLEARWLGMMEGRPPIKGSNLT